MAEAREGLRRFARPQHSRSLSVNVSIKPGCRWRAAMAGAVWCAALAGVDPRGARTNRAASADGSAQFRRLAADLSVPGGLARAALLCVILISGLTLRGAPAVPAGSIHGATPVQWSVRMADAEMGRLGDRLDWKEGGRAKWDYTAGLFTLSILKLDEVAPDPRHLAFAERAIGSFITPDGGIHGYNAGEYQLDNINPGKTVLMLYGITKEERYRNAAALLRAQLDTQPRTSEGGFWHKQKYPHQMWLDGLYMAAPFYAEYAMRFNEPAAAFEDVAGNSASWRRTPTIRPRACFTTAGMKAGGSSGRTRTPARRRISGAAPWGGTEWRSWTRSISCPQTIPRGRN